MIQLSAIKFPAISTKLEEKVNEQKVKYFSLVIGPLLPGLGNTLGNSLRRALLSNVPGFGITRVTINDITHEYQGIDGVVEDAMNIILNLKQIRAKIITDDDQVILKLNKKKAGDIFASDFKTDSKVEITNPELYICHLSKDQDLTIEIEVSRGFGYLSVDKISFSNNLNQQNILVDALFSPVTNVSLNVSQVRVGDQTDFDRLTINFQTDGTVSGKEVVDFILSFIIDIYEKIRSSFNGVSLEEKTSVKKVDQKSSTKMNLPEDLLLILDKNGIQGKDDLQNRLEEVSDFSGITKKHLKAIEEYLQ